MERVSVGLLANTVGWRVLSLQKHQFQMHEKDPKVYFNTKYVLFLY